MFVLWNSFLGIEEGIVSLLLLIDSTIYWAFSKLFSLYVELASARIFDINDFDNLIKNIYLLIGVVALFLISYLLLKNMISADEKSSSKEIIDIIKRFLISMVLIPLVPVFFDFLYDFQNSLLSNQTITKLMLGGNASVTTSINVEFEDENGNPIYDDNGNLVTKIVEIPNNEVLKDYGNQAAFYILSGFINPEDGYTASNIKTNASDYFNLGHNLKWAGIACVIGGGIATATVVVLEVATSPVSAGATLAAIPTTIGSFGGAIVASCGIGALSSGVIDALGYAINYDEYTWEMAQYEMITTGDFSRITSFSENITGGELHYTPIISTIAAIYLLYMMFSFCLDLGVRAVKLIFFQLMAPICFLISVIPKKKDLLNNWFKLVLTTWLEVFIRIFCVCGVVLFISMIDYESLKSNFSAFATAILILGIVTFAKQLPKLFSQLTGIDSGNMKLGIKEKLAEGSFGLSNAAGTLARKTVAGIDAKRNGYNFKDGWNRIEGTGPLAKLKKARNNMLPFTASMEESRRKASEQAKEIETKNKKGHELIDKYGSSGNYIESLQGQQYVGLKTAFKNRKSSKELMLGYQAELEAARASGDASWISEASKNYNDAKDKYDSFDNEFKQLLNSSKFANVGRIYNNMKYVEDREKTIPDVNNYRANSHVSNDSNDTVRRDNEYNAVRRNGVNYTTESNYNPNSQEPTIILSQRDFEKITSDVPKNLDNGSKQMVSELEKLNKTFEEIKKQVDVSKNLDNGSNQKVNELEKLNKTLEEIKRQVQFEKNPKHIQEAQLEINEINRKINEINKNN